MNARNRPLRLCLLAPFAAALAACAGVPQATPVTLPPELIFDDAQFGPPPPIVTSYEIFMLEPGQSRRFLHYFHDPYRAPIPAHQRVANYLDLITSDFHYDGDTLTAAATLERGSGNCMSLAILTTALADLADVEIAYQLMDSPPVYQAVGEVIYKGVHARSILYDPAWRSDEDTVVFRRPGIRVDYFPSGGERLIGNLPRNQFIAMYYSNLAADALAVGDLPLAYWLVRKTLEFDPRSTAAINLLAVVHRRSGDVQQAEDVYRFGIDHLPNQVSLLRNYRILLTDLGRLDEARDIDIRLDRLDQPNPFDWIHAAQQAHREGRYSEALSLYERAIDIAPYLHEGYFGMARSHLELGDHAQAETDLARALERTSKTSTRMLYKAKLMTLRESSPPGQ